jgi:hypothetical protein
MHRISSFLSRECLELGHMMYSGIDADWLDLRTCGSTDYRGRV